MAEIKILKNILEANDAIAAENVELFKSKDVVVFNVMSSPGAGKTSLTLETIDEAKQAGISMAVIEGDIASKIDAERIKEKGITAVQINTGGACHLDANMIRRALKHVDLDNISLLLIENVGNLVCPAEFQLGESYRIMLFSVVEGDDKPHKYPLMFTEADVLLINKVDLLESTNFNMEEFKKTVRAMNPDIEMFEISCTTRQGIDSWASWFKSKLTLTDK